MNQFKRAKVVMLPTKQFNETRLGYYQNVLNLNNFKYDKSLELFKTFDGINVPNPQHLYIISDDEIKEDDYHITSDHEGYGDKKYKIIATTDTSLNLPQPSQQFIQKYIEEYNKGNIITDVKVEYYREEYCSEENYTVLPDRWRWVLKINPKDNTITIKKVKDSLSRKEVKQLIYKYCKEMTQCISEEDEKWIEENL